jgi:hypothetical protein
MSLLSTLIVFIFAINNITCFPVSRPVSRIVNGQRWYCINLSTIIVSTVSELPLVSQRPFVEEILLAVLPGFVPTFLPLAVGIYLLNSQATSIEKSIASNKELNEKSIASIKESIASNKESIASNRESNEKSIASIVESTEKSIAPMKESILSNKELILIIKEQNEKTIASNKELNDIIIQSIDRKLDDALREFRSSRNSPP